MAEEWVGPIHDAPRRMVAGLMVVATVAMVDGVMSLPGLGALWEFWPPGLRQGVWFLLFPGIPMVGTAGAVMVGAGLSGRIPGGKGWWTYRSMYVLATLALISHYFYTSIYYHIRSLGLPWQQEIKALLEFNAIALALSEGGSLMIRVLTLWAVWVLFKRVKVRIGVTGGALFCVALASGCIVSAVRVVVAWMEWLGPRSHLYASLFARGWEMAVLEAVGDLSLGVLVLMVLPALRVAVEGPRFPVEVGQMTNACGE